VPPGLRGLELTFLVLGIIETGKADVSNLVAVVFR